ncbi:nitroreductase family protein [Methylomagnum ishizawai]|uniref:nitroreductase family protein n=1 Tax=Methylomagnum ishizawai TaxID=1760988 RepID=UPI001C342D68|nr:nitroreductase family protein [Methylomagnum ishizawai]BBL74537.1 oxidoreductase [Methylomagnum ishizawai]
MFDKPALTQTPIADPLARRWSGRAYDPARPVEPEKLAALLEAARWSPSCFGDQPWRYLIWDRLGDPERWRRAFDCLVEGNRGWAIHAPVLMLACADRQFADGRPNRWGQYDTGAASMSLSVEATALGLMVHQMGGYDPAKIRAEFAIPERYDCMAMLTLGYQLPESQIPEDLKAREYAARSRRPLGESFFVGDWDRPYA